MKKLRTILFVLSIFLLSSSFAYGKIFEGSVLHAVSSAKCSVNLEPAKNTIIKTEALKSVDSNGTERAEIVFEESNAGGQAPVIAENQKGKTEAENNKTSQIKSTPEKTPEKASKKEQNAEDVKTNTASGSASEKKEDSKQSESEPVPNLETPATGDTFDYGRIEYGVLTVNYRTSTSKRVKLAIEKEGKRYIYNLQAKGNAESFPLQLGSGQYKVSILENTEGTSYRTVKTDTVNVNISDPLKVYLNSIQNINWNSSMKAITKAGELTNGLNSDNEKIKAVYNYIVTSISYDGAKLGKVSTDYVPSIDDTYSTRSGICYDYASLLAAMLRSTGIPAKLVKGQTSNAQGYHAWNEVYNRDKGQWIVIDATYDSQARAVGINADMVKDSNLYVKSKEY